MALDAESNFRVSIVTKNISAPKKPTIVAYIKTFCVNSTEVM